MQRSLVPTGHNELNQTSFVLNIVGEGEVEIRACRFHKSSQCQSGLESFEPGKMPLPIDGSLWIFIPSFPTPFATMRRFPSPGPDSSRALPWSITPPKWRDARPPPSRDEDSAYSSSSM